MNHRIVSTVVVINVALFVVAAGMFAWAAAVVAPLEPGAGYAPDDPHPPARRTEPCLDCHTVAADTIPVTHRHYQVDACSRCHRPAVRVLVPHSVAMGEARCPLCHGEPARDLGMPESHLRFETGACLLCHPVDTRFYDRQPGPAGLSLSPAGSIAHPIGGVFADCDACHHVPARSTLPENHRDFAPQTCMDCHKPRPAEE